jgi:hypothetical protein
VRCGLPVATHVRVECLDALGRTRLVLLDAFRNAGSHRTRFSSETLNPGRYWIRMTAGAGMVTKAIEVMR